VVLWRWNCHWTAGSIFHKECPFAMWPFSTDFLRFVRLYAPEENELARIALPAKKIKNSF
jgi:hypothetical protein